LIEKLALNPGMPCRPVGPCEQTHSKNTFYISQ